MLTKQLCDKGLQYFESYRDINIWIFVQFYKVFYFCLAMCKDDKLKQESLTKEKERVGLLQDYYFNSLMKAIKETHKKHNESNELWKLRVKENYFLLRNKSFLELQKFVREDYALIYSTLNMVNVTKEGENLDKTISSPLIFAVLETDY